jgi:hypothetical protein
VFLDTVAHQKPPLLQGWFLFVRAHPAAGGTFWMVAVFVSRAAFRRTITVSITAFDGSVKLVGQEIL